MKIVINEIVEKTAAWIAASERLTLRLRLRMDFSSQIIERISTFNTRSCKMYLGNCFNPAFT
jgi:hypothetical protein